MRLRQAVAVVEQSPERQETGQSNGSKSSMSTRTSCACRFVSVFSKMRMRWVLTVAIDIPRRAATAIRPPPSAISSATAASVGVRPHRVAARRWRRHRSSRRSMTSRNAAGGTRPKLSDAAVTGSGTGMASTRRPGPPSAAAISTGEHGRWRVRRALALIAWASARASRSRRALSRPAFVKSPSARARVACAGSLAKTTPPLLSSAITPVLRRASAPDAQASANV